MLNDILIFLKSLSFIDYVFFFTVVFLLVLVVSLFYFIKVNEEIIKEEDKVSDPDNLKNIVQDLKNVKPVSFTTYEKDQEDKAIISYDELLSNTGEFELNYLDEENQGDLTIKKVDLENLVNVRKIDAPKMEVHLVSLKKEEEFLNALKEFEKLLG